MNLGLLLPAIQLHPGVRIVGYRKRPLRSNETSFVPWRSVPVYRVKAPSRKVA